MLRYGAVGPAQQRTYVDRRAVGDVCCVKGQGDTRADVLSFCRYVPQVSPEQRKPEFLSADLQRKIADDDDP
nr:hypothetical protein CFP56_71352 [Quercus suber]